MRKSKTAIGALTLAAMCGAYMTREGHGLGRQAMTPEQLNSKGTNTRAMAVRSFDKEARTVELAFSSEYENGERWFGIEILDHGPEAIQLDRLRDGGALLVNHDWDDQVGVVESVTIGADRVGRAVVRFGSGARASEIFQDVVDGIRKHVSVGYRILDAVREETRDGDTDVYRVTRWEPFEISLVPVPFDPTVGVGRGAEIPQVETSRNEIQNAGIALQTRSQSTSHTMNEKILRDAAGNLVRAQVNEAGDIVKVLEVLEQAGEAAGQAGTRALNAERTRASTILQMGEQYPGCAELARSFVADGKSVDEFTRAVLEHVNTRASKPVAEQRPTTPAIGMSDTEVRRYSLFNVVRALANPGDVRSQQAAAFEIEASRAAEQHLGRTARGMLVPEDVLGRAFNAGGMANTPAGATSGANLVHTTNDPSSFIEMLRHRTTIMRLARVMGGLVGNVEISKQTGGATAGWIGEGADAPEGTPTIGQLALSPKTVSAYTDVSRKLLQQSSPDAESIVRADLVAAMGLAIDLAGYYGSGTGATPRGLKNYAGINAVDFAAVQPTYAELVAMESQIAADNADVQSMGYVMNAIGRGALKTTQKFTGTNGAPVWEPGNTVNGYRAEVTNQLVTGDVFFGNFADLIVAMWGGLDLIVDPYSLSKSGGLRVVTFQDVDFALRRVESICYGSATVIP